jgi:predicted nucleotidyltransferase
MNKKIQSELIRIENERGVRVLYAVESGSRAWGFASTDSDYDRRDYLRGDVVWLKKYLYVLRPICACRWIERGLGPVPMEFAKLVNRTIDDVMLRFAIADLVVRKRNGEELDRAPRVPVISEFVETELFRLADSAPEKIGPPPVAELDAFFRNTLLKAA